VLHIFLGLLAAHFIVDYGFQGDTMAREKSRHSTTALQKHVPWYYWMTAHASLHAVCVAAITGSLLIGVLELLAHFAIDYGKCERWYNIHADQAMHLACKAFWVTLLFCFPEIRASGV
jgi:hypothetical protein